MKYVVTGLSRLTGERVVISNPKEKETAQAMMERLNRKNHGPGRCAYRKLKLASAESEEMLPFKPSE